MPFLPIRGWHYIPHSLPSSCLGLGSQGGYQSAKILLHPYCSFYAKSDVCPATPSRSLQFSTASPTTMVTTHKFFDCKSKKLKTALLASSPQRRANEQEQRQSRPLPITGSLTRRRSSIAVSASTSRFFHPQQSRQTHPAPVAVFAALIAQPGQPRAASRLQRSPRGRHLSSAGRHHSLHRTNNKGAIKFFADW